MKRSRFFSAAVVAVACATGALALVACAGGKDTNAANVKPGDMPEGEAWNGVYYHPVFGYLHLKEQGTNIIGKWKRSDQSAWGELSGAKVGTVFHYTWKEHKYGLVGPAAESHGKGFFVYKMGPNGIAELDGQYGIDSDETGSDWHSVKQQRVEPDLDSIKGDMGGTAPAAAQKWE